MWRWSVRYRGSDSTEFPESEETNREIDESLPRCGNFPGKNSTKWRKLMRKASNAGGINILDARCDDPMWMSPRKKKRNRTALGEWLSGERKPGTKVVSFVRPWIIARYNWTTFRETTKSRIKIFRRRNESRTTKRQRRHRAQIAFATKVNWTRIPAACAFFTILDEPLREYILALTSVVYLCQYDTR